MTDYISRETLLNDKAFMKGGKASDPYVCGYLDALDDLEKVVEAIPAADVAEVKDGRWELIDGAEPRRYGCSECKILVWMEYNYCPNCGAKMDGGATPDD